MANFTTFPLSELFQIVESNGYTGPIDDFADLIYDASGTIIGGQVIFDNGAITTPDWTIYITNDVLHVVYRNTFSREYCIHCYYHLDPIYDPHNHDSVNDGC